KHSEHPLAEAIVAYAKKHSISFLEMEDFHAIPGHGIKATINSKHVLIGNRKLMQDHQISIDDSTEEELKRFEVAGKTAMIIAINGEHRGIVTVTDTIKETAPQAIQQLKNLGMEVVMLTGDNERTAKAIASQVGIDKVVAQVLPEEKADKVKELQLQGNKVAMVGDGV